jgi:hypothetical protein
VSEEGAVWDECKNWGITKNGMSGYTVLQWSLNIVHIWPSQALFAVWIRKKDNIDR